MGCCCGTQEESQDRVIQTQIIKAVQEQEQLQCENDEEEIAQIQFIKQEPEKKKTKMSDIIFKMENSDAEEQKQEKKQSKKKTDTKRGKLYENNGIQNDEISNYYELILNITHLDLYFDIYCKGLLVSDTDLPFTLRPLKYLDASQHSSYETFFKQDTYFSIDQSIHTNRHTFETLLEVQRTLKRKQEEFGMSGQQTKNQVDSPKNLNSRKGQKIKKQKFQTEVVSEMLEIMLVFDLELCPKFHQLLFFLLFQQQMPELRAYFINISEVYFFFDQKPSMDEFCVQKVGIFYEYIDYSLFELQEYLILQRKQLSHVLYLKLFYDLLSILYSCYRNYLYRCNFTLKSIFYTSRNKKFKLQTFARLQTLIRFTKLEDIKNLLMQVNESKQKFFIRDFEKDLGAICDIALLFKNPENSISNIKKIRRKKKNSDIHHEKYLEYASEMLDFDGADKLIYETIRLKCQFISKDNFEILMEEIKTLLITLEAQITTESAQRDKRLQQKEEMMQQNQSGMGEVFEVIDIGLEDENLYIFSFDIQAPKQGKKVKNQTEMDLFNEVKFSSLLFFDNFVENCENFLKICTNDQHKAYALILLSTGKTFNIPSRERRLAEQEMILQNAAKVLSRVQIHLIQDSFSYYCLLSLICKIIEKPISILNQLKSLIQQQNQIRKKWIRPKLSSVQNSSGIIEMRKAIILDLFFIEHYLRKQMYQNATYLIQHVVTQQLKFNLKNYLLYARTLFVSGLLSEKMVQPVSAMLNLEVCRLMYDNYFPIQRIVFIDEETKQQVDIDNQENIKQYKQLILKVENEASENVNILEFHLGIVYFSLGEKENALKCLRNVRNVREKKFDLLSDEVIEVIIQILKIHVEQDENGAAMEICQDYKKRFTIAAKQQVYFKSRQIARLQLIMAAIYECNQMIVSALTFYQRAIKTFNQSKSSSYVRQLHIMGKIRNLIESIKEKGYQSRGLAQPTEFKLENLLGHLSEKVKPYFKNQFIRVLEKNVVTIYNQKLKKRYLRANQYLRNLELQKALRRYNKIHQSFKKSKIDECYGFALEKIGTVELIQKNMKNSIVNLGLAVELHERFLIFPIKETRIISCYIYILVGYAYQQKVKEVQNQITLIDEFIESIQELLNWQNIPYKFYSNKFAVLSNKLGRQSLFQLNELFVKIDTFNQLKINIGKNLNNESALKNISTQFINEKFNQQLSKNLDIENKRKSCLLGLFNFGIRRKAAENLPKPEQLVKLQISEDNSKQIVSNIETTDIEIKFKSDLPNSVNQNEADQSKIQLPSLNLKQQQDLSETQKQTSKMKQQKQVKQTIDISNSDIDQQKNNSKIKSSLPPTALVSPVLSPISIKSPSIKFPQEKKLNPFEKVKRKK